jgi:hypothetical protein
MDLNKKWWHRLLKIIFIIFILLSLALTIVLAFDSKPRNIRNSAYINITEQKSVNDIIKERGSISFREFNARNQMEANEPIPEYKIVGSWTEFFKIFLIGIFLTFFASTITRYFYFYIVIGKHKFIFNETV